MVLFKMEKRDVDGKILNSYIFRSSSKFHRQSLMKCRVFLCSKRFPMGFQILENVKTMSFLFWTLLVINTKCSLERGISSKCSLAVYIWMEWRSDSPAPNSQIVLGNKAIFLFYFLSLITNGDPLIYKKKKKFSCHFIANGRKEYGTFSNYSLDNFQCVV